MTIDQLKLKWSGLSDSSPNKGFRSIRISAECIANIFIGVNSDANRCLILALPIEYEFSFKGSVKQNLKIEYFSEKKFIVLQLTDNSFYDLFDDLIISLYQRIKDLENSDDYCKEFIRTFFKWSEFFEESKSDLLSENTIKGIFGELIILKKYIIESNPSIINDVLISWQGPYDKGHDFILNHLDIEVKTKDHAIDNIRISSEYQLDIEFEKPLQLLVVSVENNFINGFSIKDLLLEIRDLIIDRLGDSTIIFRAINQKGLTLKNVYMYDNFKFKAISKITYDCCLNDFPKLIKSNIPKEVHNVKYSINLNSLKEFIINIEKL